jgi:cytidine deaminase
MKIVQLNEFDLWKKLSVSAWKARDNAKLINLNSTKVGVSIMSSSGEVFSGCNAQHEFRSHDIHAEICAISNMYANSDSKISEILVVSERDFLTPCGSCLDWIIRFSLTKTKIGIQSSKKGEIRIFDLNELMPFTQNNYSNGLAKHS